MTHGTDYFASSFEPQPPVFVFSYKLKNLFIPPHSPASNNVNTVSTYFSNPWARAGRSPAGRYQSLYRLNIKGCYRTLNVSKFPYSSSYQNTHHTTYHMIANDFKTLMVLKTCPPRTKHSLPLDVLMAVKMTPLLLSTLS